MSYYGLTPPTPYTGTNPTLATINILETEVDEYLLEIMPGGSLAGTNPFVPGDSISSFQASSSTGSAVVGFIIELLTELAELEAEMGNSQRLWDPFSSSPATSLDDTFRMPNGWSGSGNGAGGGGGTPPATPYLPYAPPGISGGPTPSNITSVGYADGVTGPGPGVQTYNIVNNTDHAEFYSYSDAQGGSTTISLAAHSSGTIYASDAATAVRITPDGETYAPGDPTGNEELFEYTGVPGQGGMNLDISNVDAVMHGVLPNTGNGPSDGGLDGSGNHITMRVVLPDGSVVGDGPGTIKHAYQYSTDDPLSDYSGPQGAITLVTGD